LDGPVQGTLYIEALDEDEHTVYDMQPVPNGDREVFVAPGAPEGRYRIFSSEGWGMLWAGSGASSAPLLSDGRRPATTVRLGRPYTLYVAADNPAIWRVGLEWGAEWKPQAAGGARAFERLPLRIQEDTKDGIVSLRFSPKTWHRGNVLRALGRMVSGAVTQMLTFLIRDAAHPDLPRLALIHAAVPAPLTVFLVPPPGGAPVAEGTRAQVKLRGVPLEVRYEAGAHDGRVRFEAVAALGYGLRVSLPSDPQATFDLEPETWRTRAGIHIVALSPATAQSVRLAEGESPVVEVRVRYAGGGDFGRVSFRRLEAGAQASGTHVVVRTAPGWQDWLVRRADGRWLQGALNLAARPGETRDAGALGKARRSVHIRGRVRGGGLGYRVQFTLLLPAVAGSPLGPRRGQGEGFAAAVSHQGDYEARLPPGRYEIAVHGRAGRIRQAPLTLELRPGGETRLDLEAR